MPPRGGAPGSKRCARCASISDVLWMKTYADDAISSNPDTSLGSIIAFYNRHPGLHSDPLVRGGVGLDLARHFQQIIGHRGLRSVPANAWPLITLFGLAGTIGIVTKGFRSLRARKRRARA